jgi:uncharacterized protein
MTRSLCQTVGATLTSLCFAAGVLVSERPASAQEQDRSDWPSSLTIGTASQGGTYFIYGAGWGNLIQEELGVNTSTEVTGGPVQNATLVQNGQLDLGMVTMGPAQDALEGESPLAPGVPHDQLRALFPMYQTPFMIIALERSGIQTASDLEGKSVGVGPAGGTPGTYFPLMFEALGININAQYGGASDLGGQLQDGLLDAFAFAAGIPIAAFSEIEAQAPSVIFSFNEEQIQQLLDEFPTLAEFEVPAGTYRSLDEPLPTVSMWNVAVANAALPESLAYEITKLVMENNDRMMQVHQAAEETLPEHVDKNQIVPFHAGAVRYFEEQGAEIPEELIPPEYQG